MATILPFRTLSEKPSKARGRSRRRRRSAEIVIFPGIRYERWKDAPAPAQSQAATTSQELLQLVE